MATKRYIVTGLLLALTGVACSDKPGRGTGNNNESGAGVQLSSNVAMNDATTAGQLLSGFYAVENNAWRWTAGAFAVQLRIPPGATQNGAALTLSFTLPDAFIGKQKSVAISASIGGKSLKSEEYHSSGPLVFTADVPGSMLSGDSVIVDFALDKTMRPDGDRRELGIIAGSVRLESH